MSHPNSHEFTNARDVNAKRIEAGLSLDSTTTAGQEILVDWEGPDDPANPKNWSNRRKWAATVVMSSFTFISPIASAMMAPAAENIAQEFGIKSSVTTAMCTSVFILGYAFGPLIFGPLSEMFGRSRVLQFANLFFLIFNLACGFSHSAGQLIGFRLLAGIGGSAPLSVGGALLADMWRPEERGKSIAIYSLAPLLGPVLGPTTGAWIAARSTWRWVFWATSIVDGLVQLSGIVWLQETYHPILLERKARKIRVSMGMKKSDKRLVHTVFDKTGDRTWQHIWTKNLIRPFAMFARESTVQVLGLYMAFIYGVVYLLLTTIPSIYSITYREKPGISGLHYIALGLGFVTASQANARVMDRIYATLKAGNGGQGRPEFRLVGMVPGVILLPAGLLIAGWTAEKHTHWIGPDIGIYLVGAGTILVFQNIQVYVIDTYQLYAASALAAVSCLRALAGFGFPLFAPAMYNALGYGKGDTVLAAFAIVIGCPAPFLFWKYGARLRKNSRYSELTKDQGAQDKKGEVLPPVEDVEKSGSPTEENHDEKDDKKDSPV